jgi:hypothetical protein
LVPQFDDIRHTLSAVALRSRGSTVYVTGSHVATDTILAHDVGAALAQKPEILLQDGQSEGIGRAAVEGFSRGCIARRDDLMERVRVFPNPYKVKPEFENDAGLLPELQAQRAPLLSATRIVIAFPGGMGTEAEVEEARRQGCAVVPVPLEPGDPAAQLLERVAESLPEAFVGVADSRTPTAQEVVECVISLLK